MVIFIEALVISPELRRKISQIAREMGFDYDVIRGDDPLLSTYARKCTGRAGHSGMRLLAETAGLGDLSISVCRV